jgi:2-polyprenyl-3-methyl-5-hydroxy-6-metoxy-1,4-benzoquinol methylase
VDIGCGLGYFDALYLSKHTSSFICADISKVAIERAKHHFPEFADKFIVLDAKNINSVKFKYNTVVMTEVLEHIENDIELISKLKKGTKVIFSVPFVEIVVAKTHLRKYSKEVVLERYSELLKIKKIKIIQYWAVIVSERT